MPFTTNQSTTDSAIPHVCTSCASKLCQGLHWNAIVVSPDPFATPHKCPMQTHDQFIITSALHRLSDFDVSSIASAVWTRHNFSARPFYPGCPKVQEINQILAQLRKRQCTILCKLANPWYKPWTLFGFWANSGSSGGMIPLAMEEEEPQSTNAGQMSDQSAEQKPFEIKAAGVEHLEEVLQKEQYRKVAQGDKVKLLAEVDGANEGESIKFELYYSTSNGGSTHFDTVSGTIKDGIGSADWLVDLAKPLKASDTFELKHEPVVRGKYGKPCAIGRRVEHYRCDFVEIPDILFHIDSAVPCIDPNGSLIAALSAALKFAADNPEKEVVIYGHTDVSGKDEYNFDLSADRSAAIKALLDNNESAWADITKRKSKPQDYQQILSTLSQEHGWSCDPGEVDGKPGPKTTAAIETFQREYNDFYNQSITVDGAIGPQTWKALFAVCRFLLETEAKNALNSHSLPTLTYGYSGKGLYPCGESFPIDGIDGSDAKNRRVEICFFDKGKAPPLLEHTVKSKKVTKSENPAYDPTRTDKERIVVGPKKEVAKATQTIIILVSGTVDPGNTKPDNERSNSYNKDTSTGYDSNWYWREDEELIKSVKEMKEARKSTHLFTYHGWSGDNCAPNRARAGAYLAERLCGGNGEEAYYKGFLANNVEFHFIGHSHGGNVINELTKRVANLQEWPATWKIRSITYLSTPFFKKLHQVNTKLFHSQCTILNVYNRYDLTQRVIADFSLDQLLETMQLIKGKKIETDLAQISSFDSELLNALLAIPTIAIGNRRLTWEWNMAQNNGIRLYNAVINACNGILALLVKFRIIAGELSESKNVRQSTVNGNTTTAQTTQTISKETCKAILDAINKIESPVSIILDRFNARLRAQTFPVAGFFEDIQIDGILSTLIDFLWIDSNTLSGPVADLLVKVITDITDVFDNTSASPSEQLMAAGFNGAIKNIEVSDSDKYYLTHEQEFQTFISRLEKREKAYADARTHTNMAEIIFTLIANSDLNAVKQVRTVSAIVQSFRNLSNWVNERFGWNLFSGERSARTFNRLIELLVSWNEVYSTRRSHLFNINSTERPRPGSLGYLMVISHSISRRKFGSKVAETFKRECLG